MTASITVPSVNFHLWAPCNMRCGFCFAPFADVRADLPKGHLPREEALAVVDRLVAAGFEKLNFVGGEPLLCPWLPELIAAAKRGGVTTSIVTNGTRLTGEWLDGVDGHLDWVGISIDSASTDTHRQLGRAVRGRALAPAAYVRSAEAVRARGIRLKVNTVVTPLNADEDLTWMMAALRPERWKVFQMLLVDGQNDGAEALAVSDDAFDAFVRRHAAVGDVGVALVPESNREMRGSYAMVDPAGRFFDDASGGHRYSRPILAVGVEGAWREVSVDSDLFEQRGGRYEWGPVPAGMRDGA